MYQYHQEAHESMLKSAAKSWVMTPANSNEAATFVKLPNEKILYTSPTRTSLSISSTNSFPGTQPWGVNSSDGTAYITNQRIVYMPSSPTPQLQNFCAPILNFEDAYVRVPFWGANYWSASVRPVPGGNIPPNHPIVELKFTFKDGGAFDYHTIYEQIKERLHHAVSMMRDQGQDVSAMGFGTAAQLANVNLEQLPAYEPPPPQENLRNGGGEQLGREEVRGAETANSRTAADAAGTATERVAPPDGPPPGYDEAQAGR